MSKYYKANDVTELINACEWRMTLAKERHGEGFIDYSKQVLDVDELTKRLSDLPTIEPIEENGIFKGIKPTIEVSEDCISREWLETNFQTVCENVICSECPFDNDDCRLIEFVVDAPSVVPSRAEGEWTNAGVLTVHCSNCKSQFHELEAMNYCPYCGAYMKG